MSICIYTCSWWNKIWCTYLIIPHVCLNRLFLPVGSTRAENHGASRKFASRIRSRWNCTFLRETLMKCPFSLLSVSAPFFRAHRSTGFVPFSFFCASSKGLVPLIDRFVRWTRVNNAQRKKAGRFSARRGKGGKRSHGFLIVPRAAARIC